MEYRLFSEIDSRAHGNGFAGAVFDGRYGYLVPWVDELGNAQSTVFQYDTLSFESAAFKLMAGRLGSYGFAGGPSGPAFSVVTGDNMYTASMGVPLDSSANISSMTWHQIIADFNGAPPEHDHGGDGHYARLIVDNSVVTSIAAGNLTATASKSVSVGKLGSGKAEFGGLLDDIWVMYPVQVPPPPVSNIRATSVSPGKITITWDAPSTADRFRIQRMISGLEGSNPTNFTTQAVTTFTTYQVNIYEMGVPHDIRIYAGNSAGFEIDGLEYTATSLPAIDNLTVVSVEDTLATISWSPVEAEVSSGNLYMRFLTT